MKKTCPNCNVNMSKVKFKKKLFAWVCPHCNFKIDPRTKKRLWLNRKAKDKLKKRGAKIDNETKINKGSYIDTHGEPILKKSVITTGARIMTHDASACHIGGKALKGKTEIINSFVGNNAIVLTGRKLKNVIVGAGAIVTKDFENCVIAGNPAKKIKELNEFLEGRKQ